MIVGYLLEEIEIYGGLKLDKGKEYVMSKSVVDQINRLFPRSIKKFEKFSEIYNPLNAFELEQNKRIFLFRSGGIGDVLFMYPLLYHLKTKFNAYIKIGTSPIYAGAYENNIYVDKLVPMPFEVNELVDCDYHLMFEGIIESLNNKEAEVTHAVDLFLKKGGVNPKDVDPKDKIPRIFITEEEVMRRNKLLNKISMGGIKKIGVQLAASSPIRSFPLEKFIDIIEELTDKKGYEVYLFGGKYQSNEANYIMDLLKGKRIINLLESNPNLRKSIVLASAMDLIIAPDSAFIHIAGAFEIPVVGLYGCFPSLIRMKYYRNAIGIDCDVACAPSFVHGHSACKRGDPPPCFSVIEVKNVMDAVDHLLDGNHIGNEYPEYNEFVNGNPIKLIGGVLDEKKDSPEKESNS